MIQGRHIMRLPFPPLNFFGGFVFAKYDCNMYFILYSPYKSIGMCKGASKQFADFKNYITCWVLKLRDQPQICLYNTDSCLNVYFSMFWQTCGYQR